MKKALIALVVLAIVACASGAWLLLRETPEDRAYAELERVVQEAEQLHPECVNFEALMASRVRGSNGWRELRQAAAVADELLDKDTPLASRVADMDDADWCGFVMEADEALRALAETEEVRRHTLQALGADCIVDTDPFMEFQGMLALFDLFKALKVRIGALAALGRMPEARAELLELLEVVRRVDRRSTIAIWVGSQVFRKWTFQWAASHLPRLEPDALFKKEVEAELGSSGTGFQEALQGELATLLWQARTWVLDGGLDEVRKVFEVGNSYPFNDVVEYLDVYPPPLRAASAALLALKEGQDLDDAATARAVIDAARPWAGDQIFTSLTESRLQHWITTIVEVDAAELALRLRCLEPVASGDGAPSGRIAARYPALRLVWLADSVEVHTRPEAPIIALAGGDDSGAMATLKWVPDPPTKYEPAPNSRRFR